MILRVLTVLVAASVAVAGRSATLAPGDHSFTVEGGRTYLVRVPPQAVEARPLPVVVALHGGGGWAEQLKRSCGLDAVADREGFLAVYPNGTGRLRDKLLTWNAGRCCGRALVERVDDVAFVLAVLDDLARRTPVDASRCHAIGHSNGGMMAYRLAAEASDRIAAIVSVGGAMSLGRYAPSRPVPVLHVHSVDDPRALYAGGLGPPFPMTATRVMHLAVETCLDRVRAVNGCAATPAVVGTLRGEAGSVNAGQTATLLSFAPCGSAPVEHWKLTGAGHGWPGARGPRTERLLGPPTTLIDASEEAWTFLKRFALPEDPRGHGSGRR